MLFLVRLVETAKNALIKICTIIKRVKLYVFYHQKIQPQNLKKSWVYVLSFLVCAKLPFLLKIYCQNFLWLVFLWLIEDAEESAET